MSQEELPILNAAESRTPVTGLKDLFAVDVFGGGLREIYS